MNRSWSLRVAALVLSMVLGWGTCGLAHAAPLPSGHPTPEDSDESVQSAPSQGQLHFADQYVKAINAHDLKALRRLVAPKTLACYNARTEPYLTEWLERQTKDPISNPYTITVEPYEDSEIHSSALFTLPVPPTHQMNITTQSGGKDVVLGRPIAYQGGRWYETAPCPTDLGMDHLADRDQAAAAKQARLDALYNGLKDPLLSDLKKLIGENRIKEACEKYCIAQKLDYKTGCAVVKRLAGSMGIVVK